MARILLKLSGEALAGSKGFGIDHTEVKRIAKEIKDLNDHGHQIAVVIGGGNIWRGEAGAKLGMDRSQADYMGMMVTIMNSIAMQDALEQLGCESRVQTSLYINQVAEPYIRRKAIRHMEKDRVVFLAGGTGMPYFSTDTNAMVKAAELNCDLVLMAKNGVDGVYDKDPNECSDAKRFDTLTYQQMIEEQLRVMDLTASTLARENNLEVIVFNMNEDGNIFKAGNDQNIGTKISN